MVPSGTRAITAPRPPCQAWQVASHGPQCPSASPGLNLPFPWFSVGLACQVRCKAILRCGHRAKASHHGNPLADGDLSCYGNLFKTKKYFEGGGLSREEGWQGPSAAYRPRLCSVPFSGSLVEWEGASWGPVPASGESQVCQEHSQRASRAKHSLLGSGEHQTVPFSVRLAS